MEFATFKFDPALVLDEMSDELRRGYNKYMDYMLLDIKELTAKKISSLEKFVNGGLSSMEHVYDDGVLSAVIVSKLINGGYDAAHLQ